MRVRVHRRGFISLDSPLARFSLRRFDITIRFSSVSTPGPALTLTHPCSPHWQINRLGSTPAHASVRVSQLHIDEQLTTSSNVDVHIRVAALNSKSYGRWLRCCCTSLPCVVCWVPFSNGNGQKQCSRLCRPVSRCPWTSEQVKSDKEEHDVSKQRSSEF
jgi:hypothetical protein